jgi:long-chain acyl-CoA synthetase
VNLVSLLDDSALRHPDRVALAHRRRAVTFTQLQRASVRVAGLLARAGVDAGDRVGIVLPNVPEFAAAYYGALRAGAVVVPLSPQSTRSDVASAAADAGARLVLAWRELPWLASTEPLGGATVALAVAPGSFYDIPQAAPAPGPRAACRASDTAAILYTSGSAGEPKGVELTHANLACNARATASLFSFEPSDTLLGALPLFHCFGQTCVLNAGVAAGASVRLIERFDAGRAERLLRDGRVSVFVGVPSMFASVAAADGTRPAASRRLRLCVSGGAPLGDDARRAFERRYGCTILEGYGLTETSPVASFNRPGDRRIGSIGTPIGGVEMKLAPDGEILVRGHNVMKGYWNRARETAAVLAPDGWLRTGDLGRVDADGAFFLTGRKSDVIIRDGHNISPAEVESALRRHPAVREAAVLGVPDPIRGEEVLACVAVSPGAYADQAQLLRHLEMHLAGYKRPAHVWAVDALPKGPTGKVAKGEIVIPERIRVVLADARKAA